MTLELVIILEFSASIGAGLLGSLVGLGGSVLIVPLLTIGFDLDIRYAIGASVVSIIATSSGAGAALIRDRLTNIRIATFLQVATTIGAVGGAMTAPYVAGRDLYLLFGALMFVALLPMLGKMHHTVEPINVSDAWAVRLELPGSLPDVGGIDMPYAVTGTVAGFALMAVAGIASGLLGIGSGALKVLAMDTAMKSPIKVSSATSNFMIGVTAAASAGVYF